MSSDENKKKIEAIETIYTEFVGRIQELRDEQNRIVTEFIKKLEEEKIKSINNIIDNSKPVNNRAL